MLGRGSTSSLRRRAVLAVGAVATSGTVAAVALTGHGGGSAVTPGGTSTAAEGRPTSAGPSASAPDASRAARPSRGAERAARPPARTPSPSASSPAAAQTPSLTRLPIPSLTTPRLALAPTGPASKPAPSGSGNGAGTTVKASPSSGTPTGGSSPSQSGSPSGAGASPTPVDGTAPQTVLTILSGDVHSLTVAIGADEPATYECALDGAGYQPCSATTTFHDLGGGLHTVTARATDAAGNTDPTPATLTVRLTGLGIVQ